MSAVSKQINFGIQQIKELEFFIDESVNIGEAFDFNYHVELRNEVEHERVIFTITANYFLNKTTEAFMKGKSSTVFLIKDMKNHSRKLSNGSDAVDLPDPLWITLFSIAFTHARALLAKSSSGTKYSHMLMPLINPEHEFIKIFGNHLNKGV